MNRFFNIWIFIIAVLSIPTALAVGLNEDFQVFGFKIPGIEFEYKELFFGIGAGLIFLLGVLKASKKWMGLRIVKQKERFQFSTEVSRSRMSRVLLYNTIELLFLLIFGAFFYSMSLFSAYLGLTFFILLLEHFLNTFLGIYRKMYRVGMTKKALIRVDREVNVIYFKGLQKITKHQQSLYFEYSNDLVLHIPLDVIPEEKTTAFYKALRTQVDPDKVFYSGFDL